MLTQVFASTTTVIGNQRQTIIISAIVTALAAAVGWIFALLVASGITRPVRQLLQGTREVEAGRLDYRAMRRDEAKAAFNTTLEIFPGDGPSLALLARIGQFAANPPPADWDGAWQMEHK